MEMKLQLIKVSERRTVPATIPEDVPSSSMGASIVGCSGGGSEVKPTTHHIPRVFIVHKRE